MSKEQKQKKAQLVYIPIGIVSAIKTELKEGEKPEVVIDAIKEVMSDAELLQILALLSYAIGETASQKLGREINLFILPEIAPIGSDEIKRKVIQTLQFSEEIAEKLGLTKEQEKEEG